MGLHEVDLFLHPDSCGVNLVAIARDRSTSNIIGSSFMGPLVVTFK